MNWCNCTHFTGEKIGHQEFQLPPIRINKYRDYPGGIVVETLPISAGGVGWTPGQRAKSTCLAAKKLKHKIETFL